MLEKIVNKGKHLVAGLSLVGLMGCSTLSYYRSSQSIFPGRNQVDYSLLKQYSSQLGQPKRINPTKRGEEEYRPKSDEEISDKQVKAGWCTAAILSSLSTGLGALGLAGVGDQKERDLYLALAALGGVVMIPAVPACIYSLIKVSEYED